MLGDYFNVHVFVADLLGLEDLIVDADEVPFELRLLIDENVVIDLVVLGVDGEEKAELLDA